MASQPDVVIAPGTMAFAMQTHKQDPTSTIALEIKRAQSLFGTDTVTIQWELTAQPEVVTFWIIRE
eukprot:scaffold90446_cov61-Attheya_sp.AAC.1